MDSTAPSSAMTDAKAPPNRESVDGITPVMARGPMDSGADAAAASSSVRLLSISDALVAKLRETLGGLDAPWKPSLLYSPQVGQKFLDTEQRSSTFRELNDPKLWSLCEEVVACASATDEKCSYSLVRNDATHIRYLEGGYFKTHQDYLSLTSNCVEEYTLLVAVNDSAEAASAEGGHTRIHFEAGGKRKAGALSSAYDTTTPGHESKMLKRFFIEEHDAYQPGDSFDEEDSYEDSDGEEEDGIADGGDANGGNAVET